MTNTKTTAGHVVTNDSHKVSLSPHVDLMMSTPGNKKTSTILTPSMVAAMESAGKAAFELEQKEKNRNKFAWETEAEKVCKEKLAHYIATGNTHKAAIYQAKLDAKKPILSKLRKLIK